MLLLGRGQIALQVAQRLGTRTLLLGHQRPV
jgi:hypothetical protein